MSFPVCISSLWSDSWVPEHSVLGCGVQPEARRAEGSGSLDSTDAQQGGGAPEADQGQGGAKSQQEEAQTQQEEARGGAQPLEKGDADAAQQDARAAREGGKQAATDVSSDGETTKIGERRSGGDTDEDRQRAEAAGDGGRRQQDGAEAADKQEVEEGGPPGGLGKGIWVIDLTVDDPAALKDGEDTYMVRPLDTGGPYHLPCTHAVERAHRTGARSG